VSAEVQRLVGEYFAILLAPDVEARMAPLCTPDVQFHEVLGEFTGMRGFDAEVLSRQRQIAPGLRIELLQVLADDVEGAARWRVSGTLPGSAEPFATEGSTWFRIAGGLIAEVWSCWDAAMLLQQFDVPVHRG
jgi:hypothetical protein